MNRSSEAVYNSLLNDNKLLPLSSFKSQKFSKYNIFPHAQSLPSFFDNNLKSDGRVVKYLKGQQGPLRAFYYQLYKLGFEIDNPHTDFSVIIKNILFDPKLASYSTSPISGKQYNISQYQRIIAEFMKIMESQVIPNAQLTFSQYPIIDEAMLTLLQLIVEKSQLQPYRKIENINQLLQRLCQIFGITFFQQSDVFLYVQSPTSFYLAFLSEMAEVESFEKTSESPLDVQYKQQLSSLSYGDKQDQSRQVSAYRDMRLSAGNKGTRARIMNTKSPKDRENKNANFGSSSFGVYTNRNNYYNEYNDNHLQQINRSKASKSDAQQPDYHKNVFQSSSNIPAHNKVMNGYNGKESQSHSSQFSNPSPQVSDIVEKNQNIYSNRQQQTAKPNTSARWQPEHITAFKANQNHFPHHHSLINYQQQVSDQIYSHQDIYKGDNYIANPPYNLGQNAYLKLNPVLDNVQTFKSISDGAQQNLQMMKNIPDYFSRVEYRAQDFMNNNIISSLSPQTHNKTQVTLKDKVFSYQFKSHKYQKNSQKQTTISLNQNLQIKSTKQYSNNTIDHKAGFSLINTAETNNTFLHNISKQNSFGKSDKFQLLANHQIFQNQTTQQRQNIRSNVVIPSNKQQIMDFYTPKTHFTKKFDGFADSGSYKIDLPSNISKNIQNSKQQTLGTYYRQFSDTKVMEAMAQPYSSRVRKTRQKFKGIRSKNFRGFY